MKIVKACAAVAALGLLALASCATTITPEPTGGNRAGGTVDMSYGYGSLQKPMIDWDLARVNAKKRCAAWGYADADPFGGVKLQCQVASQYGCSYWNATMTYQCTGNLAAPAN
jgi:hypothetical protein